MEKKSQSFEKKPILGIPHLSWKVKQYPEAEKDSNKIRFINTIETISPSKLSISGDYKELDHPMNSGQGKECSILVVQDLGFYSEEDSDDRSSKWEWVLKKENLVLEEKGKKPQIFLKIDGSLPNTEKGFWNELLNKNQGQEDANRKQKALGIIYADTLRNNGIPISKRISWERTAQDYLKALYTHTTLSKLGKLGHLVVRFGISGAIYSYEIDGWRYHRLFFDPNADQAGIYRDSAIDGDVIGNQSIFLMSIIKEIEAMPETADAHKVANRIGDAIRKAIICCQEHFERGLGDNFGDAEKIFKNKEVGIDIIDEHWISPDEEKIKPWKRVACVRIPVGNVSWSIVNQSATYNLLGISKKIVMNGLETALNLKERGEGHIWAPIVKFGEKGNEELKVIDRKEIESYRAVYRLLKKAITPNFSLERPLSIAVFGPPGAGKSFVVTQILSSLKQNMSPINEKFEGAVKNSKYKNKKMEKIKYVEINLSELKDSLELKSELKKDQNLKDLYNELQSIKDEFDNLKNLDGKKIKNLIDDITEREAVQKAKITNYKEMRKEQIPFVFIDEFDCSYGESALGWLKYFLKPMEDWKKEDSPTKCPIFIFAGGTSHTFLDFSKESLSPDSPQRIEFLQAKGPDFVSRLDGHINILGPDQTDDNDESYLLRRAIVLRSIILGHVGEGEDEGTKQEMDLKGVIGTELVNAMLKITSYKHGMRSMRAIFDMSVRLGGMKGPFVGGTLPPLTQLDMHVDGKEFMSRISEPQ